MLQPYTVAPLAIEAVQSTGVWDIHPFLSPDTPVLQPAPSLQQVGLLVLPLMQNTGNGIYECITGFRSLTAARQLNPSQSTDQIACRILPANTSSAQILHILYREYSASRTMSQIEQAHFLRLCERHLPQEEQEQLFTELQLFAKQGSRLRLLNLTGLPERLQMAMMHGTLADAVGQLLLRHQLADQVAVYNLIEQLQLGGGKQRRLVTLLSDLAGREQLTMANYLAKEAIQAVINHPQMNVPQKAQTLLTMLQRNHTPSLAAAEKEFESWRSTLALPSNTWLDHSTSFERDEVTLSITFRNREEFEKQWKSLQVAVTQEG